MIDLYRKSTVKRCLFTRNQDGSASSFRPVLSCRAESSGIRSVQRLIPLPGRHPHRLPQRKQAAARLDFIPTFASFNDQEASWGCARPVSCGRAMRLYGARIRSICQLPPAPGGLLQGSLTEPCPQHSLAVYVTAFHLPVNLSPPYVLVVSISVSNAYSSTKLIGMSSSGSHAVEVNNTQ
jgi:hypothetical protein